MLLGNTTSDGISSKSLTSSIKLLPLLLPVPAGFSNPVGAFAGGGFATSGADSINVVGSANGGAGSTGGLTCG